VVAVLALLALQGGAAPIQERPVTVPGVIPLGGTLTLPTGDGPFPGVVIVHGSGGGDRDGTLGPNTPYRDLARGLAERGIAVLRYDKRSGVQPFWFLGKPFTVNDEVIDDAVSALAVLRRAAEVDPARTVLVGHSFGGYLAPRIAARDNHLAGLVLWSGAFEASIPDLMEMQLDYLMSLSPADSTRLRGQRQAVGVMAEQIARLVLADSTNPALYLGAPPAYWLDLRGYHPAAAMRSRPEPLLVLAGSRDYQVPPALVESYLADLAGRSAVTVHRYEGLNHLLIAGTGPASPADYRVAGRVSDRVIDDLAAWITALPPRR
jgi:dienelactone hydrolase